MSVEREEIVRKALTSLPEWLETREQKHVLTQQRMKLAEIAHVINDQDQYMPGPKCTCGYREGVLLNNAWNLVNNSLEVLLERRGNILSKVRMLAEC